MASLRDYPPLAPSLYAVPPFARAATVCCASPTSPGFGFTVGALGILGHDLRLLSISYWTFDGTAHLFGSSRIVVPEGARWWAIASTQVADTPTAPGDAYRVRWELHV